MDPIFHAFHMKEWSDLMSSEDITPCIRTHLKNVYISLCLILLSLAIGFNLQLFIKIGGLCTVVSFLGSCICFFFIPPNWDRIRVSLLVAAAFFKAVSIGYFMDIFGPISQSFMITALIGMALICGSFMIATWRQPVDRSSIYFNGTAYSFIAASTWFIVASNCFRHVNLKLAYPYLFVWFVLYVLTYSQEMVVQVRSGNYYVWQHVTKFFTHMPALQIYAIIIVVRQIYIKIVASAA